MNETAQLVAQDSVRLSDLAPLTFLTRPPNVKHVHVNDPNQFYLLPCRAQALPRPRIKWLRGAKDLDFSDPRVRTDYRLTSEGLEVWTRAKDFFGDYTCVAYNDHGVISASVQMAPRGQKSEPIVFVRPPEDARVVEGGEARFECLAVSNTSRQVAHRWLFEGVPVDEVWWLAERFRTLTIDSYHQLIVASAALADVGRYGCVAEDGDGNIRTESGRLVVEYAARVNGPKFTAKPLVVGAAGSIECSFDAVPPVSKVVWFRDEAPLMDTRGISFFKPTNNSIVLRFENVSSALAGTYRCVPYNIHGNDGYQDVKVFVKDAPVFLTQMRSYYR